MHSLRFRLTSSIQYGQDASHGSPPRTLQSIRITYHGCSADGHDDVERIGGAETSPCFLSRGLSRLLLLFPFCLLFLFLYLLLPTLVLIPLAFVSHCVSPFSLSLIFFPRGCRCVVSSGFGYLHCHEGQR